MDITLQYFPGCPNWREVEGDLVSIALDHPDLRITHQLVETSEAAERASFRGSPTILVDGTDPFADPDAPVGLSCRLYATPTGRAGSPGLQQLRDAIAAAERA